MSKRSRSKPTKRKRNFWADGFSIDETRFSMLAVLSVIGFIYALYADAHEGIGDNLLSLINSVLLSFVGVNVAESVSRAYTTKKRETVQDETYNEDEGGGM